MRVDVVSYGAEAAWNAAKGDFWATTELLVNSRADLSKDGYGAQILAYATATGQDVMVSLLVNKNVLIKSDEGCMALARMASINEWPTCSDAARVLVVGGVDMCTQAGSSALYTAAVYGDLEMVKLMVENGVDVHSDS